MSVEEYPCSITDGDHMTVSTGLRDDVILDLFEGQRSGQIHSEIGLSRDDVARLHRQLGAWLGANPTGIVDRCPGSGQKPASMHKYGRTGACPVCGDQLHVTTRTGVIYKHRRRTS